MTLYGRTSQSQCFIFACEHQKSQSSSQEPWWVPMPMPDRPGCIPSLNRGLKCTPEVGEGCHTRASSRRWSFPLFLSFSAYPCCPGTQARSFGWVAAILFYHLQFRLAVKARIRALLGCQVFLQRANFNFSCHGRRARGHRPDPRGYPNLRSCQSSFPFPFEQ